MKKIIIGDFIEYQHPSARLGNYHICNQFVRDGYEALWMSNVFNELIWIKDRSDYGFKRSLCGPTRHKLAERIYGYAPWAWRLYGNYPFCRDARILKDLSRYIRPEPRKALRAMDFEAVDVLWVSNPKMFWLADVVQYRKLAYRIADDYTHFKEFPNLKPLEDAFIRRADAVFITSEVFKEKVTSLGVTPTLLNNAVDLNRFASEELPVPPEYQVSGRKRIVYVGAIKYWLDQQLLARLSAAVDADIFLIGAVDVPLDALKACANIQLLGPRSYETVAAYMHHADVAVIPFVTGALTAAISPLKMYEYCAAGTPVVSTAIEEVCRSGAPVEVSKDDTAFIEAVKRLLTTEKPTEKLREYARRNSWEARYAVIKEVLDDSSAG